MSKYFDGYASFDYKEMSKEKLITELKEKVRYIGELKRNNNEEIAKVQSVKDKTIADLEKQLTEKEKEIFFYQNVLRPKPETVTEICELIRPYELKLRESEMYKDRFESLYNHYNKDKISFCVKQLEKVKECFINGYAVCKNFSDLYWNFTEQIDNQIEQLTHQHEDKGENK